MSDWQTGLYRGFVTHRRLKPTRHAFRYRFFWTLIDLATADRLGHDLRLFSYNKPNLFSLYDRDHLDGSTTPLAAQVEAMLAAAGLSREGGTVRLMCLPRLLGYAFNPISVFFCHDRDGRLYATLYEVNNTFGQRHCYLMAADGNASGAVAQRCAKNFHVSPFMDMNLTYRFRLDPPGAVMRLCVDADDPAGPIIATAFEGRHTGFSDKALLGAFFGHPLLTLKVVAGIHWEALRLWLKGVGLRRLPPAPATPLTIVAHDMPLAVATRDMQEAD